MAYPNRLSTVIPAFIAVIRNAATTLADWLCAMISQRQYHPEAYYMRGPGPKWREKHSLLRDVS